MDSSVGTCDDIEFDIDSLKNQGNINWDKKCRENILSESVLREYQHKFEWQDISRYQKLSENFIEEFQNKVNWNNIIRKQNLPEKFVIEFEDQWYDYSHDYDN